MGYPAKAVANYFLERYRDERISPLQMQKLVYVAHGWHLAFHGKPLVDDEHAEAWQYGPVFASLYHEFKHFGKEPIFKLAVEVDVNQDGGSITRIPKVDEGDKDVRELLDRIWDVYGGYSALELSGLCHQENSPWDKARHADPMRNAHIDNAEIEKYYKEKLQRNEHNG